MEPITARPSSSANAGTASPGAGGQADAALASSASTSTPAAAAAAPPRTVGIFPAPLIGHMLDYLPCESMEATLNAIEGRDNKGFGDAAAAAAAKNKKGKKDREDVERFITTLNITEASQLDGPTCKKFTNVEEVNCLSFLRAADDSPDDQRILVVCRETAVRLVPVLSSFPKLRRIYVGGGFL